MFVMLQNFQFKVSEHILWTFNTPLRHSDPFFSSVACREHSFNDEKIWKSSKQPQPSWVGKMKGQLIICVLQQIATISIKTALLFVFVCLSAWAHLMAADIYFKLYKQQKMLLEKLHFLQVEIK